VLRPEAARRLTCCYVVVELRGFEPLTPCMPSRDPRHDAHHKPSRSRPLHQSSKAGAWWFVRLHRAELLRACCANARAPYRRRGAVGTTFVSTTVVPLLTGQRVDDTSGPARASRQHDKQLGNLAVTWVEVAPAEAVTACPRLLRTGVRLLGGCHRTGPNGDAVVALTLGRHSVFAHDNCLLQLLEVLLQPSALAFDVLRRRSRVKDVED
jgi:hypothetical protein